MVQFLAHRIHEIFCHYTTRKTDRWKTTGSRREGKEYRKRRLCWCPTPWRWTDWTAADSQSNTRRSCSHLQQYAVNFIIDCTLQSLRRWRKGVTLSLLMSELRVRDWGSDGGPEIPQRGLMQSLSRKRISMISMRHRMPLVEHRRLNYEWKIGGSRRSMTRQTEANN